MGKYSILAKKSQHATDFGSINIESEVLCLEGIGNQNYIPISKVDARHRMSDNLVRCLLLWEEILTSHARKFI